MFVTLYKTGEVHFLFFGTNAFHVKAENEIPWSQRFFLNFSSRERAAKRRMRVAKRRERKTSGYLGPESHFHADAGCQTRQIYNYKRDQWQLSNHVLISR